MKTQIMFLVAFAAISCKAQITLAPLEDLYEVNGNSHTYYKDQDGDLDKFVGVWEFTNGTEQLRIEFQKLNQVYDGEYLRDVLIGEYQYKVNGAILISTLPLVSTAPVFEHKIVGSSLVRNTTSPVCSDCAPGEKRVRLNFVDPQRVYLESVYLTLKFLEGTSPQQIRVTLANEHGGFIPDVNSPTETIVPYGTYVLTKL